MKIRLASYLQQDSIVDGEGVRTVVWTQGCLHNCPFCHNPATHDMHGGMEVDVDEIKEEFNNLEGQSGITFSGGDPIYQIDAVIELASYAKSIGLNTWLYTGFLFEEVLKMKRGKELLKYIDIIVDGKFEIQKRSLDLLFRGSSNQRVIDVPKSLEKKSTVICKKYNTKKDISPLYKKDSKIFI